MRKAVGGGGLKKPRVNPNYNSGVNVCVGCDVDKCNKVWKYD